MNRAQIRVNCFAEFRGHWQIYTETRKVGTEIFKRRRRRDASLKYLHAPIYQYINKMHSQVEAQTLQRHSWNILKLPVFALLPLSCIFRYTPEFKILFSGCMYAFLHVFAVGA